MREFLLDRPSVTDGPFTVDPGSLLLEVGLFEYTRDRYNAEGVWRAPESTEPGSLWIPPPSQENRNRSCGILHASGRYRRGGPSLP
jgi:hypothetical protein